MKKLARLLIALTLTVGALVIPATASATVLAPEPPGGGNCTTAMVTLYEDFYYLGQHLDICYGGGLPQLGNIAGPCWGNWRDCASSAKITNLSGSEKVCVYHDANYNTNGWKKTWTTSSGPNHTVLYGEWWDNMPIFHMNDGIESVKITVGSC